MPNDDVVLDMNHGELTLLKLVLEAKGQKFDSSKAQYTETELRELGFIRENWTVEEIQKKGLAREGVVTSFDEVAERAKTELPVDAPFARGIQKWQLPINMFGFRMVMTTFPPGTVVKEHTHQSIDGFAKCGQLRVVIDGSITYENKVYGPGDWFFIPNGVPYSFVTDKNMETRENYFYQYGYNRDTPLRFSNFSVDL